MKKYKFAILGYYGFGNLGDELLLKACSKILEADNIPPKKIIVLSNNPQETEKIFNVKSVNRWKYFEVIKALRKTEILLLGGGGLFQDSTSVMSCVWYWGIIRLAKFLGLKVIALGQSIGELNSKISRFLTGNALRSCEKIFVRDEHSFNVAKKLGCKNLILSYDLVLTLKPNNPSVDTSTSPLLRGDKIAPPDKGERAMKWRGSILINLRPCNDVEKFVEIISPHVKNFDGEKIGVALSNDDEKILECYKENLSLQKIILLKNFNDAENLWSSASCAVGMRLHFGVLSRIFQTPVALIPYDIKVKEFAKISEIPVIINEWKEPLMPLKAPNMIKFDLL